MQYSRRSRPFQYAVFSGLIGSLFIGGRAFGVGCPEPEFWPQPPIPVANFPSAIGSADFNGDGHLDVVIGDSTSTIAPDFLTVRLGSGTGSFGEPTSYQVGDQVASIAIADFDKDGNLDLVSANAGDGNVSMLLGDGHGGFGAQMLFPAGPFPWSLVSGDFNEDGNFDIAVTNFFDATASILLGDGAGGFGPRVSFPVGNQPISLAVGDVDNDGHLDLAVARTYINYDVATFLGDGLGGFSSQAATMTLGFDLRSILFVDIDADGVLDLVAVDAFFPAVKILEGAGNGQFNYIASVPVGAQPIGIAAADFTSDGHVDLVVANADGNSISVLLGDGLFGFGQRFDFESYGPVLVSVGDVDGNGSPDLFATSYYGQRVSLLLNACELNRPPDCTHAAPSLASLWPPSHRMVPVEIVGITDPDGDPVEVRVSGVTQDEPVGDESECVDAAIATSGGVRLRAERLGKGNGRVYAATFTAMDGKGGSCTGTVFVCVPHDSSGRACVDDGQATSSLGPCGSSPGGGRHRFYKSSLTP